ncbi:MAG TPA: DUF805 domain-containing protein [Bacteroidia bacterium]|nr:DUF805 domain-containing protein [Bacteroidia bacterium]
MQRSKWNIAKFGEEIHQILFLNLFSFKGRISKTSYRLSIYLVAFFAFSIGGYCIIGSNAPLFVPLFFVLVIGVWFKLAQGAKRCHDIGKSGWVQFIPFYELTMFSEEGEHGTNKYGEQPKMK